MADEPNAPNVPQTPRYVSPFGKPRGLRARLAKHRATLSQPGLPWHGTGFINDLELLMKLLDKREWLEAMRTSDDADAQRFAAELLDDADELETVETAAANVNGLPDEEHALPGVETIERLDAATVELRQRVAGMRAVLERAGVVDDGTPDEMLPDLLQALLA